MHDDIESIDFVGFINSEVQAYRSRLNELADENKRKQRAKMNLTYALFTDRGDRAVNEDSIGVCSKENEHCFVLCDGLGGHGMGDAASSLVAEVFKNQFKKAATHRIFSHQLLWRLRIFLWPNKLS